MTSSRLRAAACLATALTFTVATAASAEDVVRIGSPYKTTTLDPMRSAAAGPIETFGQLYSRLLRRDRDGNLHPGLAESWTVSEDDTVITLRLREAKFSDGTPITAEDVVFSLLRVRDDEESAYPAPLQQLAEARALDARTVELTLEHPFAPFLGNLEAFNAGIVSKRDVEARGDDAFSSDPATSGPYRVREWRPNDRLILEANPHYWREGYPLNDGAELIEVAAENTRVAMMQGGELDAAREIPWSQINDLMARENLEVPLEPSTVINIVLLNHARAPFDDLRVRQAAAHALDVEAITQAMTFGHARPANTTLPAALEHHYASYPGIPYDPERARALLAKAGGVDEPVIILITDNPQNEKMAVLMQAQWMEIGLPSKIEKVDGGTWWDRIPGGDYDAAPTWYYNETPDPDLAVRWALCGTCGNRSFYTNYDNPKVNDLLEQGARELDPDKRAQTYYEIQRITTEEVSQIPLFYPPFANAYSTRIEGLIMTPALQWTLEETRVVE